MSAGDKDRSGFHRVGGSLTQARSHASAFEHEHCSPNMLTDLPGSSACGSAALRRVMENFTTQELVWVTDVEALLEDHRRETLASQWRRRLLLFL